VMLWQKKKNGPEYWTGMDSKAATLDYINHIDNKY